MTVLLVVGIAASAVSTARGDGGLGSLLQPVIGGGCGTDSTPFAPWGDGGSYYLAPGGDFSGATSWTLTGGAQVASGAPISALSPQGPQLISAGGNSLLIPAGASATSPATCFGLMNAGIRFFATSESGTATIQVSVVAVGALGGLTVLDGGSATVGPGWAPTPVFSTLVSQLDVPVGTKSIEIEISASSAVQIDDVYVDPWCSW